MKRGVTRNSKPRGPPRKKMRSKREEEKLGKNIRREKVQRNLMRTDSTKR